MKNEGSVTTHIRELSIRYRKRKIPKGAYRLIGQKACSSKLVYSLFKKLRNEPVENFYVLHLNTRLKVDSFQFITKGGVTQAKIEHAEVIRGALLANATAIIILHNHPSGHLEPSVEDKILTIELQKTASLFDIKIVDHIIIGASGYFSFADERIIRKDHN